MASPAKRVGRDKQCVNEEEKKLAGRSSEGEAIQEHLRRNKTSDLTEASNVTRHQLRRELRQFEFINVQIY